MNPNIQLEIFSLQLGVQIMRAVVVGGSGERCVM